MPSTMASVLNNSRRPGAPTSSTAQSSPTPVTTAGFDGREAVNLAISSNSFICNQGRCRSFKQPAERFLKDQQKEINRIENAVRANGGEQVIGFLIQQT